MKRKYEFDDLGYLVANLLVLVVAVSVVLFLAAHMEKTFEQIVVSVDSE